MSGRWRLFVAVELPDDVRAAVIRAADAIRLDPSLGRTPDGQRHLTLLFLGAVEPERVPAIEERIDAVLAVRSPFSITLSGLGQFPERGKARVVWVGVRDADGDLSALAGAIKAALADLVPTEDRPFHGHITVARAREPARLPAQTLGTAVEPVRFEVDRVALFRSHMGGGAPARYEALRRWHLGPQTP
jgi:2'-5' RNA ligase